MPTIQKNFPGIVSGTSNGLNGSSSSSSSSSSSAAASSFLMSDMSVRSLVGTSDITWLASG